MRSTTWAVLLTGFIPGAVIAGWDKPVIAPPPDWVKPVALPAKPEKPDEAPARILLADQQSKLEPGRVTGYVDIAMLIQSPEGLQAGNLSLPWNPETNEITVHKVLIHRDGKVIDILAGGQTFTVVRREPNLENATLDGMLTANIQPEGLQVGDVLEYAMTVSSVDPIFKGHAEELAAGWNGLPFSHAHMSVQWPSSMAIAVRQNGALPPLKPVKAGDVTRVELSLDNVQPTLPPRLVPARYAQGRLVEFSDFKTWSDVGALMAPLYAKASVIPAQGPLRDAVEKIKAASADPVKRAEAALALVQDRVRYVALLMGTGGYVPAMAEETWGRRYGDCKAKSALLLALLRDLGIGAEPVAANVLSGDGLDQRLPMIGLFNHVLVRAHVGGADYWLDGTRQGDTSLARLRTPDFGWGLPLVAQGATLVRMVPKPLEQPDKNIEIAIDARGGLSVPAPIKVKTTLRGDSALATKLAMGRLTEAQRDRSLREYWKDELKDVEVTTVAARFDAETGEEVLTMDGKATMDWSDGWYHADRVYLGYDADFSRQPGPDHDVPFANDYPFYNRTVETIQLPAGFPDDKDMGGMGVDQTVAGTAYFRKASLVGNVFRIEASSRSVASEFAAKDAPAAQVALKAMTDQSTSFRRPSNYRMNDADVVSAKTEKPTTAGEFINRGLRFMDNGRLPEAKSDFDAAVAQDANNVWAFADRALLDVTMNDLAAAQKDIDAAAAIDPENSVLWHARGRLARARKSYPDAIAAFSHSIANNPKDNWAIEQRAAVNQETGNFDAARGDFDMLTKLDPEADRPKHLIMGNYVMRKDMDGAGKYAASIDLSKVQTAELANALAGVAEARSDFKAALAGYDRALAIKPNQVVARWRRANAYAAIGDDEHAFADYDTAIKGDPKQFNLYPARADFLRRLGRADAALATAKEAIDAAPMGQGAGYRTAALIYELMGKKDEAIKAYDQAIAVEPLPYVYLMRSGARPRTDLAGREADIELALKKAPTDEASLIAKAQINWEKKNYSVAVDALSAILARNPKNISALNLRGVTYARAGDKDHADADFTAAAALAREPMWLNNICYEKAISGVALDRALAECDASLAKEPNFPGTMDSRAFVLLRLGRVNEAIATYDSALTKRPRTAQALYGRAVAWFRKGDKAKAQADREAALKLEPDIERRFEIYGVTMPAVAP
jgi:tetratricopeptide (TPR) repeat protein